MHTKFSFLAISPAATNVGVSKQYLKQAQSLFSQPLSATKLNCQLLYIRIIKNNITCDMPVEN
jgi:hypothetical protein